MTTKQLAHFVYSITRKDLSTSSMAEKQDLVDALNLTLSQWLDIIPEARRHLPFGLATTSPVTQPITLLPGAKAFAYDIGTPYPAGGYASESDAIGATATITGTADSNRLIAPGTLLYPNTSTESSLHLTLYGDAIHLPPTVWGIEGHILLDGRTVLQRFTLQEHTLQLGTPSHWQLEPINLPDDPHSTRYILRLHPIPDRPYRLSFTTLAFPSHFTVADLFAERTLSFLDLEASLFTTAAKGTFAASGAELPDKLPADAIISQGNAALERIITINRRPIASGPCRVGTPTGF